MMTLPTIGVTPLPLGFVPNAVLDLPVEPFLVAAISLFALLAAGAVAGTLARAKRPVRPAPVPSSAAA